MNIPVDTRQDSISVPKNLLICNGHRAARTLRISSFATRGLDAKRLIYRVTVGNSRDACDQITTTVTMQLKILENNNLSLVI